MPRGVRGGCRGEALGRAAGRLEGIYLGLATFAMGVATPDLLKKQTSITGGVKGISLPPVTSPTSALSDDQFFYLLCLAIACALFALAANVLGDRTGRAWRALRDGELAATAFVGSDAFPFTLSIGLLVGAVVGGIGTIAGAVFGGLLSEFLPIYAQQLLLPISKDLANAAPGAVQ